MVAIVETVKALFAAYDKVRDAAGKAEKAEVESAMALLKLRLAETQTQVAEMMAENGKLRDELAALNQCHDVRGKLVFRDRYYYLVEKVPGFSEGPFCPKCLDGKVGVFPMYPITFGRGGIRHSHACTHCGVTIPPA